MFRLKIITVLLCTSFLCAVLFSCALTGGPGRFTEETFGKGGMKKGPRTIENITANIERIKPRIYYLYSQQLPRNPDLAGIILFYFDIESNGDISHVSVHQSTLNDPLFEDLLEGVFSEIKFDVWKEGGPKTVILYPIEFNKSDAQSAPRSRARKAWEKEQMEKSKSGNVEPLYDTDSVKTLESR